jgi:stage III sporulation protein AH
MTTIYVRFKSILTFGLIVFSLSFLWFSLHTLKQENELTQETATGASEVTNEGVEDDPSSLMTLVPEVNNEQVLTANDFFSEYRLERERALSEQTEILQKIIANDHSSTQMRTDAQQKLIGLTENLNREAKIENALIAKGFSEAIAVIQEPSVLVIVPSEGFRQDEIARIADIVTKIAQCRWEDVVIIPKTK